MARTKATPTPDKAVKAKKAAQQVQAAATAQDVTNDEQRAYAERTALIIRDFGDGLPFDQYRYEDKIKMHMSRSAEEMLAAGRALVVAREHLPHGEWGGFLERIGLVARLAQRMMQAAIKFSNASLTTHLIAAAGSKTKLFELMVLDDDDLEELNEGRTVAGLKLDDISSMPTSALRIKVRDIIAEKEAQDQLLEKKNKALDKAQADKLAAERRISMATPEEAVIELRKELSVHALAAEHAVRLQLREGIAKLLELGEEHRDFAAGLLASVANAAERVREEFNIARIVFGSSLPDWAQEDGGSATPPKDA